MVSRIRRPLPWATWPRTPARPTASPRDAQPEPTATLVALAAAGRNPTDLTLPTAGSQAGGSGGSNAVVAGSSGTTTAAAGSGGTVQAQQTGGSGGAVPRTRQP